MMDGVTALLPVPYSMYKSSGRAPERGNELLSGRFACYNLYRASDNRWLSVGCLEQKFWAALCGELGCPELIAEQFASEPRQSEIKSKIAAIFSTATAREWFERLGDKDCCVAPVRTIEEVHQDPHFATDAIGMGPKLSRTPAALTAEAPQLGEHTDAVLRELGFSDEAIEQLRRAGVTS
jgi:crotonobetainyl-CoA:carnitine CoA-transferase CaiB-like acyl-CoA transferase